MAATKGRRRPNVYRIARLERGLSAEEVAAASGISPRRQRQLEIARSVRPRTADRFWRAIAELLELERNKIAHEVNGREPLPRMLAAGKVAVHERPSP